MSVVGEIWLTFFSATESLKRHFVLSPDEEAEAFAIVYPSSPRSDLGLVVGRREALMSSGCQTSHGGAQMVGQDVILNYPVTGVQQPHRGRMEIVTLWMAPELSASLCASRFTRNNPPVPGS